MLHAARMQKIPQGTSENHLAENFNPMKSASCNTEESETFDF